jgi:hypothetical protein
LHSDAALQDDVKLVAIIAHLEDEFAGSELLQAHSTAQRSLLQHAEAGKKLYILDEVQNLIDMFFGAHIWIQATCFAYGVEFTTHLNQELPFSEAHSQEGSILKLIATIAQIRYDRAES